MTKHTLTPKPSDMPDPTPALEPLDVLIGTWSIEGSHVALPGSVLRGQTTFEWLEGKRFLIQRERIEHPDVPDSISIIGANIMGKRMFDQGERAWPEEAPFHTPVYVLTHEKREPWVRPGGTTFYFINDGPERALELARKSAGSRDIRIAGGADVIQQYLNLGVVDELEIALAPVLFGGGRRLFENLREPGPQFRIDKVLDTPAATHLRYVRQ